MIAYKVFRKLTNGHLQSAGRIPFNLQRIYQRRGVNRPKIKNSKIFCFGNIEDADYFAKEVRGDAGPNVTYRHIEIWEVEVDSLIPIYKVPRVWSFSDSPKISQDVINFWQETNKYNLAFTISGCMGANTVKLLKKVKEYPPKQ